MRCRTVQQKLDPYVAQELTPRLRDRMDAHLQQCEACRRELQRVRDLADLLTSEPAPPAPDGFSQRVVARARRESLSRQGNRRARKPACATGWRLGRIATAGAALAAGLLLGAYLGMETWRAPGAATASSGNPRAGTGVQQFTEPEGASLADAYFQLISGSDS